jgi:hypothetical protein
MVRTAVTAVLTVCLGIVAIAPCTAAQPAEAAAVEIKETAVVASGVTPGATVVFFGVSHESDGYRLRLAEYGDVVTDEDRDGEVRYEIGRPISSNAVFVAVDLRGGRRAMAAGSFAPLKRKQLPPSALRAPAQGKPAHIDHPSDFTIFWIVRPGIGAWRHAVRDGGPDDGDGTRNGRSTARLDRFAIHPAWPAAPDDFRPGDLVFAVDPFSLDVSELTHGH